MAAAIPTCSGRARGMKHAGKIQGTGISGSMEAREVNISRSK